MQTQQRSMPSSSSMRMPMAQQPLMQSTAHHSTTLKARSTSLMVGPSLFSDDSAVASASAVSPALPPATVTVVRATATATPTATSPQRQKVRRTLALSVDAESISSSSSKTNLNASSKAKPVKKRSMSGILSNSSSTSSNRDNNELASERKGLFEQDDDKDDNDSLESFRERVKVRQIKRKSEIENLKMHLSSVQRKTEELEAQLAVETKAKEEFAIRANECHKIIEKRNKQLIKASERFTRYTEQTETQIADLKASLEKMHQAHEQKCLELQKGHEQQLETLRNNHNESLKQVCQERQEMQQRMLQKQQDMELQLAISSNERDKLTKKVAMLEQANRDAATRFVQSEEYKNLILRVENAEAIARGLKHQLQKEQGEKSFIKKQFQRLASSNDSDILAGSSSFSKRQAPPPQYSPSSESERSDAAENIDLASFDYFRLDPTSPSQAPVRAPPQVPTPTSLMTSPTARSPAVTPAIVRETPSAEPLMSVPPMDPTVKNSFEPRPVDLQSSDDQKHEAVETQQEHKQENENRFEPVKLTTSGSRKMPTNFFEKISIRFKRPTSSSADEATLRRVGGMAQEETSSASSPFYVQESTPSVGATQKAPEGSSQHQPQPSNGRPKLFVTSNILSDEDESSDSLFDSDGSSAEESENEEVVSTPPPPPPPLPQEDPFPSRSVEINGLPNPPIRPPLPTEPPSPEPATKTIVEPSIQVPLPPLPTRPPQDETLASEPSLSDYADDSEEFSDQEQLSREQRRSKTDDLQDASTEKRHHESNSSSRNEIRSRSSRAQQFQDREDSSSSGGSARSTSSLGARISRRSDPVRSGDNRPSSSRQDSRQEDGGRHRHREKSSRRLAGENENGKARRDDDDDDDDDDEEGQEAAGFSRMNEYMEERARKRMEKLKRRAHKEDAESKKKEEYEREWERMAQEEKERRRKHQQQRRSGRRRPASMKAVRVSQMKQQMNLGGMQPPSSQASSPPPPPPMANGPFSPPQPTTTRGLDEPMDRQQSRWKSANSTRQARDSDSDHDNRDERSHSQPTAQAQVQEEPPLPPEPAAVDPELYLRQQARLRERHEQEMKKKQEAEEADLIRGDIHKRIEMWAFGKELLHLILTLDQITALEALRNFQMMVIQSPDNETIRKAYRNIIRVIHPDKLRGVTLAEQLEARELFTVLNKAFEDFRSKAES